MIIMPALINKSQHAAAMVQGLTLRDGSKVFKTVECRGSRCLTGYRGSVAIFASKSYCRDTESHYEWFGSYSEQTEQQHKRNVNVKLTAEQSSHYRAWSQYSYAWSYKLIGFVRLTGCTKSESMLIGGEKMRKLHRAATDYRGNWMYPPPATYLHVESMHELTAADGPKFSDVCYGCTVAQPHHNPTACHVNWQTVALDEKHVPTHIQKELGTWQPK